MISGLKQHLKTRVARDKQKPSKLVDNPLVRATTKSLIALRQQARSVPLSAIKIISPQSGAYLSPFKGRGMEYEESRIYQPGDDIRNIDWRVTARSGKTYSKQFREERERSVLMWVDYRQTMLFATKGIFKSVMAARAAALLAWSAVHQGDRIGGLIFDEQQHYEIKPQNGDKAALHLINQLCHHQTKTNDLKNSSNTAEQALIRLRRVTRPGSLVILISDFRRLGEQAESHLMQLSRHNDVIMFFIFDPLERNLPPTGTYRISDGEQSKVLNTANKQAQSAHQLQFQQHFQYLQSLSRRFGMSLISCATDQPIEQALQQGLRLKRS